MFDLIRTTPMKEYNGTAYFYRHDRTGMEVLFIKNDSSEMTCAFTFATPSQDSKGLAHIIEHTVLSGSGRFPVKDPFTEIYNSSPNTFLNAMTFYDKTMYPFSSPLKKDFDIIFDIYSDAVFNPLLRRESFEQEGVRFFNGKVDGVVFNEMRGARSTEDSVVAAYSINKLFNGTGYEHDSGGNPEFIADLTYEEFIQRYRLWYSPANCRLFFFGNIEIQQYLDCIETRYLGPENDSRWVGKKIYTKPSDLVLPDVEDERDVRFCSSQNANSVVMTWLTNASDDPYECLTASILTDILLGNPGAPLYKAITESDLGDDLNSNCGMDGEYPFIPFTVGFVDAKPDKEDEIEKFIISALKEIVNKGLEPDAIDAALKRQAFKIREIKGTNEPYGLMVAMRAARYWLRGTEPEKGLDNLSGLERLKTECKGSKYFENWIRKNLIDNHRRCLLTVKEDKDCENRLQKILDEKCRKMERLIGLEKLKEYQKDFELFCVSEDSEEELSKIPRITRNDLPDRIPKLDLEEVTLDGVPVKTMKIFTRGICYINLAFDVTFLNEEEKKLLTLLIRFMQMSGTKKHDYSKLGTLVKKYTGDFNMIYCCASKTDGNPLSVVFVRTRALEEDVGNAFDITREILLETDFSDEKRIRSSLIDIITDIESDYLDSANAFATIHACSSLSAIDKEADITMGTQSYLYLKELLDSEKKLGPVLKDLHDRVFGKNRLTMQLGCEEEYLEKNITTSSVFIQSFPLVKEESSSDFYDRYNRPEYKNTRILVSSGPAYNALAFRVNCDSQSELAGISLFCSIVSGNFLFDEIRSKNGAYGAECHLDLQEKILSMSSYRDPQIQNTLKIFKEALSYRISEKELDSTVVTIIGKELKPMIPKAMCFEAFRRSLYGMSDDLYLRRRKVILSMTLEKLAEIARKLREDIERGCSCSSVCSSVDDTSDQIIKLGL